MIVIFGCKVFVLGDKLFEIMKFVKKGLRIQRSPVNFVM